MQRKKKPYDTIPHFWVASILCGVNPVGSRSLDRIPRRRLSYGPSAFDHGSRTAAMTCRSGVVGGEGSIVFYFPSIRAGSIESPLGEKKRTVIRGGTKFSELMFDGT